MKRLFLCSLIIMMLALAGCSQPSITPQQPTEPEQLPQQIKPVSSNSEFIFDRASGVITGYTGAGGDLVIPAQVGGVAVTGIGEDAFRSAVLTSIVIPEGITSIGNSAFGDQLHITGITLPSTVKTIGNWAFWRTAITSLTIPEGVEAIGDGAFAMCGYLTSLSLPSSLKSIGGEAFANCRELSGITLPQGLESIGNGAFRECQALSSVELPSSVKHIGSEAFHFCGEGFTLTLATGNPHLTLTDGVLFNAAQTELMYCTQQKNGWYDIPPGVEVIGRGAFANCGGLSGLTIPASVKRIENHAFIGSGIVEIFFAGERPNITAGDIFPQCLEYVYYQEGAAGWPGEPIVTVPGRLITPESNPQ